MYAIFNLATPKKNRIKRRDGHIYICYRLPRSLFRNDMNRDIYFDVKFTFPTVKWRALTVTKYDDQRQTNYSRFYRGNGVLLVRIGQRCREDSLTISMSRGFRSIVRHSDEKNKRNKTLAKLRSITVPCRRKFDFRDSTVSARALPTNDAKIYIDAHLRDVSNIQVAR